MIWPKAEGPGFESRCCLLTTGPRCHRCALTCLKTESKTGVVHSSLVPKAPLSLQTEINLPILNQTFVPVSVSEILGSHVLC